MHGRGFATGGEEIPGTCVNVLDVEDPARQAGRKFCGDAWVLVRARLKVTP